MPMAVGEGPYRSRILCIQVAVATVWLHFGMFEPREQEEGQAPRSGSPPTRGGPSDRPWLRLGAGHSVLQVL
jgi:hypothetical protein